MLGSALIALVLLGAARPASASLISAASRFDVDSVPAFCDLLLADVPLDGVASAEIFAHAAFFRVARGTVPRLDGPDDSAGGAEFVRLQNLAGRHGGRIVFTEFVAGLDQVTRIAVDTLADLNTADAARVRRAFDAAFARQHGIFGYLRARHQALDPAVRHKTAIWIGRAFATEIERRAAGPRREDLGWLYPRGLAAQLAVARDPRLRDPQLTALAHGEVGHAVLAVYGLRSGASPDTAARAGQ